MEIQLEEYEQQLSVVKSALLNADCKQRSELLELKSKLEEVVSLLTGKQVQDSLPDNNEIQLNNSSNHLDDEFDKFKCEIAELESNDVDERTRESEAREEINNLAETVASLEGEKCRAPFSQEWGAKDYHNAMIISADFDPSLCTSPEDIEVKVMFCNPICDNMKPCDFFLNGYCKFSDDKCRYSHGYSVRFSELREFVLPDYSTLKVDSKCLAQTSSGLWSIATVEKCLDSNKFIIKYDNRTSSTLEAQCIFPLGDMTQFSATEEDESSDEDACKVNNSENYEFGIVLTCGEWEQHTRGIGAKLMEKMGHVWGQGLGKHSDGRLDPIEAVILPSGKSLDKCIEMRDNQNPKGPVMLEDKLELEKDKEEQRAKRTMNSSVRKRKNVFEFINSKISKIRDDSNKSIHKAENMPSSTQKQSSKMNLNIELYAVGEDIKNVKKEIVKLQQTLNRNRDKSETIRTQVENKLACKHDLLQKLVAKETKINNDIKHRNNKKSVITF